MNEKNVGQITKTSQVEENKVFLENEVNSLLEKVDLLEADLESVLRTRTDEPPSTPVPEEVALANFIRVQAGRVAKAVRIVDSIRDSLEL